MKLLIIDDTKSITDMLCSYLELKGHECVPANDGRNGLQLLENENFDIVTLDIAMPEFSGFDVMDTLNKDGKPRKIGSGKTKGAGCFAKIKWEHLREFIKEDDDILVGAPEGSDFYVNGMGGVLICQNGEMHPKQTRLGGALE